MKIKIKYYYNIILYRFTLELFLKLINIQLKKIYILIDRKTTF